MRSSWPTIVLVLLLLALLLGALHLGRARQPLQRAWRASQAQSSYRVRGESGVRAPALSATWRVVGSGRPDGALDLELSRQTARASAEEGDSPSVALHIEWPSVLAKPGVGAVQPVTPLRAAETSPAAKPGPAPAATPTAPAPLALAERSLGAMLPGGDPLLLLATAHGARSGGLEPVPPIPPSANPARSDSEITAALSSRLCRRVDFLVSARAYATFWQAHPGHLPVNGNAGGLWKFGGQGTAWLDPHSDLPCRIQATLSLPRVIDDRPGTGRVDWVYDGWRTEESGS